MVSVDLSYTFADSAVHSQYRSWLDAVVHTSSGEVEVRGSEVFSIICRYIGSLKQACRPSLKTTNATSLGEQFTAEDCGPIPFVIIGDT